MSYSFEEYVSIFFTGVRSNFSLYVGLLCYFWAIWLIKCFLSYCVYRPYVGWAGKKGVSVIVPTYKESNETLQKSIEKIIHESNTLVREVIIVTDEREPDVTKWCNDHWRDEPRVRAIVSPVGKRQAVRLGVETASEEFLVIIESDTFAEQGSIDELVKPLAHNDKIGGVVGDQLIYEPTANSINFFNNLIEIIKYRFTIPALSVFGSVTVLGGRCISARKCAIMPLMDGLQKEQFLGRPCISGDDGRLTSLLLCTGWQCVYQRTAVFLTISPPSLRIFMKQRMRWARNSCRRTIRAIFCIKEGHVEVPHSRIWAYTRPAALFQILTVWVNTFVMTAVVALTIYSLITGTWFWLGRGDVAITIRIFIFLVLGMAVRRLIRVFPACKTTPLRYVPWLFFLPWYLFLMWMVRIYSIFTMNKQGWVTRTGTGAGGFGSAKKDSKNDNVHPETPEDDSSHVSVSEQWQGGEDQEDDDIEFQFVNKERTRAALRDSDTMSAYSPRLTPNYDQKDYEDDYYHDLSPKTREVLGTIEC